MTELILIAIGVFVIVLFSRVQKLDQELARLRERLASEINRLTFRLEKGPTRPTSQADQTAQSQLSSETAEVAEPVQPRPIAPPRPAEEKSWADQFRPTPIRETAEAKVAQFAASIATPAAKEAKSEDDESKLSLEELLAGKWLTWIGALAVILGAGFFFKYAIDMGWIQETERVIIGLVVGLAVFAGGVWGMLRDYRWLAMGLIGAAAGILYFDLWAASKLYGIIAIAPAFAGMVIVTAATLAFSTKFDAQPTAILGLIGGYLTPLVLSTGVDAQWFYFSYLLLLDLGVLAIGVRHDWRPLNLTAFLGSLLLWLLWYGEHYELAKLGATVILLSAFFALFVLLGIWQSLIRRLPSKSEDSFLLIATPIAYFGAIYGITLKEYSDWHGLMSLGMSAFYGALAWLQWKRCRDDLKPLIILGGLGITFLVLAVPLQFTGHWVPIAWALLSLVLAEAGLRCRQPKVLASGLGLLAVVQFVLLFFAINTIADPTGFETRFNRHTDELVSVPETLFDQLTYVGAIGSTPPAISDVFNGRSLTFLVSAAVMAILAWEFRRHPSRDGFLMADEVASWFGGAKRSTVLATFLAAAPLTLFAMLVVETSSLGQRADWLPIAFLSYFAIWGALTALALMLLARRPGPASVYQMSILVFGLTALFLVLNTLSTVSDWPDQWERLTVSGGSGAWQLVLLNPRGLGFIASLTAATVAAWLAFGLAPPEARSTSNRPFDPVLFLGVYAYIAGLLLLTTEIVGYGTTHGWERKTSLAVTATWTLYAIATLLVGIRQRSSAVRVMALTLFLIVTGKVFLHDVWYLDKAVRTIAFMLLGVSLLLVSWLYRRYRERIRAWFAAQPDSAGDVGTVQTTHSS